jgi:regulator of chromosome condensation
LSTSEVASVAGSQENKGRCFVFGTGDGGQLGLGDDVDELPRPRWLNTVPSGALVMKIACGGMHTLAIVEGGLVYSWGVNDEGALGRLANKDVAGSESTPGLVDLPSAAIAVDLSTGDSHVAVVTADGAIVAWGTFRTSSGLYAFTPEGEQICRTPTTRYVPDCDASRAVATASGTDHVLALTKAGEVYSWGCGEKGRLGRLCKEDAENISKRDVPAKTKLLNPGKVSGVSKVTAIFAGSYHSFGIAASSDGSTSQVFAWGLNSYGQLGVPYDNLKPGSSNLEYFPKLVTELSGKKIVAGDAGEAHTVLRSATGDVFTFGRPAYGRLGVTHISPTDDEPHSEMNHVVGVSGRGKYFPFTTFRRLIAHTRLTFILFQSGVVGVFAGASNSGCVTENGEAYVWGYGTMGQLGRGDDETDATVPTLVKPTKNMGTDKITQLSFGGQHSALLCLPPTSGGGDTHTAKRARG